MRHRGVARDDPVEMMQNRGGVHERSAGPIDLFGEHMDGLGSLPLLDLLAAFPELQTDQLHIVQLAQRLE